MPGMRFSGYFSVCSTTWNTLVFPPAAGLTLIHGFPDALPGIMGLGMVFTTACTWLCAATERLRTTFLPFINSTRKLSISLPPQPEYSERPNKKKKGRWRGEDHSESQFSGTRTVAVIGGTASPNKFSASASQGLCFPFQCLAAVAVLCDEFPHLLRGDACRTGEIFDLVVLVSRCTIAVAKVSFALIISHFRSSRLKVIHRNAIRGDLFQFISLAGWPLFLNANLIPN
jgi:hypothetical protein